MAVSFRFDFAKARAALLYLASQNLPGFDKGKACKLLFLADKLHLVRYSRPITGDRYWALEHGPVPSRLLVLLNQIEAQKITDKEAHELAEGLGLDRAYVNPRLQARQRPDMDELSQSDVEALNRDRGHPRREDVRRAQGADTRDRCVSACLGKEAREEGLATDGIRGFLQEDSDAIVGARDEMIENDVLRRSFPAS